MKNCRPTGKERGVLGQEACAKGYNHESPWPKPGTLNTQHGCVVGRDQKEAGKLGGNIT